MQSYFTEKSLLTMDWKNTFSLLRSYDEQVDPELKDLYTDLKTNQRLIAVKDLLSPNECDTIISKCKKKPVQDMGNIVGYERDNSRLVVLDQQFADLLWSRLKSPLTDFFTKEDVRLYPRGFDVAKGKWEFSGINNAMRFNQYESIRHGMFGAHRDSQYCPSGDERSMLSLVIYLNDGFSGGSTNFYFPEDLEKTQKCKGLSLKEELEINGGLKMGYEKVEVEPVCGDAVIFSQDIIHESSLLLHKNNNRFKYVIKTDVVLRRVGVQCGFSVSEEEKNDYMECLNFFRLAQQQEMDYKVDFSTANELYEKCLSIRYAYPTQNILENWYDVPVSSASSRCNTPICGGLSSSQDSNDDAGSSAGSRSNTPLCDSLSFSQDSNDDAAFFLFPAEVWMNIMLNLSEIDLKRLIRGFKVLEPIKQKVNELKCVVPHLIYNMGVFSHFSLDSAEFVNSNLESCCRVLAVYSVFLLGNSAKSQTYAVKYDDVRNEVLTISLNQLLRDVYYRTASYGVVMKVMQKGNERKPEDDLQDSVDKMFMKNLFGRNSFGRDKLQINRKVCKYQRIEVEDEDSERETEYQFFHEGNHPADILNTFDKLYSFDDEAFSEDDLFDSDDESDQRMPVVADYKEGLEATISGKHVGAAIVRSIKEPMVLQSSEFCVCGIGGYSDDNELSSHCTTEIFNHLIADFRKHNYMVKEVDDDGYCCPFYERLLKKIAKDKKNIKSLKKLLRCYSVDITPLNDADMSFQHASCNCVFYDYQIKEYANLRSYPYLDHVHVALLQDEDQMLAWTSYGGVAAL